MIRIKILKDSKEIEEMKDKAIALYQDKNTRISVILKDSNRQNINDIELSFYMKNEKVCLILKSNDNKTYQEIFEKNDEEMNILEELKKMERINVFVYAKEKNIQQIITVELKNAKK